jgi:branched-chain amino acid transport system substrate-binding protein
MLKKENLLRSLLLFLVLHYFAIEVFAQTPIGIILPLSGEGASFGKSCQNGITLAKEDFKNSNQLAFYFEDDQNSPTKVLSAQKNLTQNYQPKVFLTFSSTVSKTIAPLAERENFIQLAIASDPLIVSKKNNSFTYWVTPESEVEALIVELKKRKIQKISLITAQQDAMLTFKKLLLQDPSFEILSDEEILPEVKDFKANLIKMKKFKDLEGIFNNTYVGQPGLLAKQARELGFNIPIFDIELYENESEVKVSQGALEGQFFINAPNGTKDFQERYRKKFPEDNIVTAGNCYDIVGLLSQAVENVGNGDVVEKVRNYLQNLQNFNGALGNVSATGDNRFKFSAVVKEIRNGKFVE